MVIKESIQAGIHSSKKYHDFVLQITGFQNLAYLLSDQTFVSKGHCNKTKPPTLNSFCMRFIVCSFWN